MEDVLDVYCRPMAATHPQVCFDESSKQQVKEVRTPLPVVPGEPLRFDTEYERNGVSNLFMFFAPLLNWRHVKVTDQRTARDWAHCMRDLVDVHFPEAERITVVLDNLNTHTPAALYATFEAAEAKRIWDKLEFHYTPKHGSWRAPSYNRHMRWFLGGGADVGALGSVDCVPEIVPHHLGTTARSNRIVWPRPRITRIDRRVPWCHP